MSDHGSDPAADPPAADPPGLDPPADGAPVAPSPVASRPASRPASPAVGADAYLTAVVRSVIDQEVEARVAHMLQSEGFLSALAAAARRVSADNPPSPASADSRGHAPFQSAPSRPARRSSHSLGSGAVPAASGSRFLATRKPAADAPMKRLREVAVNKYDIAKFAGTKRDTLLARSFLRSCVNRFQAFCLHPDDWVEAASMLLVSASRAEEWYHNLPSSPGGQVDDWRDFEERFSVRFFNPAGPVIALRDLAALAQADSESVDEYLQRYEELVAALECSGDRMAVSFFAQGLRGDIRGQVDGDTMDALADGGSVSGWTTAALIAEQKLLRCNRLDDQCHRRPFPSRPRGPALRPPRQPRGAGLHLTNADGSAPGPSEPACSDSSSDDEPAAKPDSKGKAALRVAGARRDSRLPDQPSDFQMPEGAERNRLLDGNLCFRCHQLGHPFWRCKAPAPVNPKKKSGGG